MSVIQAKKLVLFIVAWAWIGYIKTDLQVLLYQYNTTLNSMIYNFCSANVVYQSFFTWVT